MAKHILLTAYSTISIDNTTKLLRPASLEGININLTDEESEKYHHIDKVYITSESVFKYLCIPQHKGNERKGKHLNDFCLKAVFTFTTNAVNDNKLPKEATKEWDVNRMYTHKEFIDERLKEIYQYARSDEAADFEIIPIRIDDSSAEVNLSTYAVLRMIKAIMKFMQKNPDEYIIHFDLTGGFRHIPFIMMMVLNVLKKTGIEIGTIAYTMSLGNKFIVEEMNGIFNMYNLMDGVHEFVSFGSGKQLSTYFTDYSNQSEESLEFKDESELLDNFVDSVKQFSEMITISNRNEFKMALEKIKKSWEAIKVYEGKNPINTENKDEDLRPKKGLIGNNIYLLNFFGPRVKQEYEKLWNTTDELEYVLWCLDHNFIQQALTLYIEILPSRLTTQIDGLCTLTEKGKAELGKKYTEKKQCYNFEYWLWNQYSNDGIKNPKKVVEEEYEEFLKSMHALIKGLTRNLKELNDKQPEEQETWCNEEINSALKDLKCKEVIDTNLLSQKLSYLVYTLNNGPYLKEKVIFILKNVMHLLEDNLSLKDIDMSKFVEKATSKDVVELTVTGWLLMINKDIIKGIDNDKGYTDLEEIINSCDLVALDKLVEKIEKLEPHKLRKKLLNISEVKIDKLKLGFIELQKSISLDILERDYYSRILTFENLMDKEYMVDPSYCHVLQIQKSEELSRCLSIENHIESDLLASVEDIDIKKQERRLMLRILLYPYFYLKKIRNDSVHARKDRNVESNPETIKKHIQDSIVAIRTIEALKTI